MTHDLTPRRIACLQPSATAILASIGELDRVIACTKYCADLVPDLHSNDRMIIADSWTPKASEILAALPDLVIAAVPYQEESIAEILKAGVRFLCLAPRTLPDIYLDIAIIAGAVEATERGSRIIAQMQTEIEKVRRQTSQLPRKRVFCEEWGKPIIASQPWVAELIDAAAGESLGEPGMQVSKESILKSDPQVIIAAWCGAGARVPLARIIRDRGWENTTAARTQQVYCISDELLNTPAPTLMRGLQALCAVIHPEHYGVVPGLRSISDPRSQKGASLRRVV